MTFKNYVSIFIRSFFKKNEEEYYVPSYRIVEITQTDNDDYLIEVQIINKNTTFRIKPEEILSNDKLVDQFSPRDIRTLTYLGYLGINSPKYKILAKKLSKANDSLIFALKKKGVKKIIVKTASEIMNEKEIIDNLTSKEANLIGYTVGYESTIKEKKQKEDLHKRLENDNSDHEK